MAGKRWYQIVGIDSADAYKGQCTPPDGPMSFIGGVVSPGINASIEATSDSDVVAIGGPWFLWTQPETATSREPIKKETTYFWFFRAYARKVRKPKGIEGIIRLHPDRKRHEEEENDEEK